MSGQASPQWSPDPAGRFELRYWDGVAWTDHVASGGRQSVDPLVPAPAPVVPVTEATAGWHPDPSGRHDLRYWDGRWTEHASSHGQQVLDPLPGQSGPPTGETPGSSDASELPPVGAPRTSKRVQRQVRRVGASDSPGGGTLLTEQVLVVNQKPRMLRSTLAYAVYDQHGRELGAFQEVPRTMATKLGDRVRGQTESSREFRFQVVDPSGNVIMAMTRPEQWFTAKSSMTVEDATGSTIGQIAQETHGLRAAGATALQAGAGLAAYSGVGLVAGLLAAAAVETVTDRIGLTSDDPAKNGHVRFGLDAGGRRLGSIHAMGFDAWDFRVLDPEGNEIGSITKTWAGWAKERFTKADNYVVQMNDSIQDPLRSLVVAAALAIDVALKQGDPSRARGSVVWGDYKRTYR